MKGYFTTLPNRLKNKRLKQEGNARILITDEEPRARAGLKELLRFSGYEITLAESGCVAVELIDNNRFDLILLELNMPDLNGNKLIEHIVQRNIDCDIIVTSGKATFDQASLALR